MSEEPINADDLDRLIREHLPAAVRFATRLTGRPDAADDLVQEALLRVSRNYKSFRGESAFRTWFFQIVINVFRDQANKPIERSLRPEHSRPVPDETSHPLLGEELSHLIAERVSQLPPRQREVIVLTVYEELPIAEVARMLDMTEQNVHATLHHARRRLRNELAGYLLEKS